MPKRHGANIGDVHGGQGVSKWVDHPANFRFTAVIEANWAEIFGPCRLRHHYDPAARSPQTSRYCLERPGLLGYNHTIDPRSESYGGGQHAASAPHHLDDESGAVGPAGIVDAFYGIDAGLDSGSKTDGLLGAAHIGIDRLGDGSHGKMFGEAGRALQTTIPTKNHQTVETQRAYSLQGCIEGGAVFEIRARSSQNRAATTRSPVERIWSHLDGGAALKTGKTVGYQNRLGASGLQPGQSFGDSGIQTGAIATGGKYTYAHGTDRIESNLQRNRERGLGGWGRRCGRDGGNLQPYGA